MPHLVFTQAQIAGQKALKRLNVNLRRKPEAKREQEKHYGPIGSTDRITTPSGDPPPPGSTANLACAKCVVFGEASPTSIGALSQTMDVSPTNKTLRTWAPAAGVAFGAYARGGFYFDVKQSMYNFVVAYPSIRQTGSWQNVSYNVVSVKAPLVITPGGSGQGGFRHR